MLRLTSNKVIDEGRKGVRRKKTTRGIIEYNGGDEKETRKRSWKVKITRKRVIRDEEEKKPK